MFASILYNLDNSFDYHDECDGYGVINACDQDVEKIGPVNYFANTKGYVKDRWFQFKFVWESNEWHAYILRMPSLKGRDPNLHYTHRYTNGNKYYICYDPMPTNLKDMMTVARAWADRELEYITTGVLFENQVW